VSKPLIADELLHTLLQDRYTLGPVTLECLPVGLDYQAAVYRVSDRQGGVYLLKITSRPLYKSRYLVPRYLYDQGILSVVAPLPTGSGELWVRLAEWTAIVYPWICGDCSLAGMTDEHWKQLGSILRQIHHVSVPASLARPLHKEAFDAAAYVHWLDTFERDHLQAQPGESIAQHMLRADWQAYHAVIHGAGRLLVELAGVLLKRAGSYVCCHADLHPANLIRAASGQVFVIDWDDVMLAPRERDFIFLKERETAAFWEGYGRLQIDWVALTYYRWERVLQDLISCAEELFYRDSPGEETEAEIARLFHEVLLGDTSTIHSARASATHLPADLRSE
jgi:spectinomycin phosphotransferase